MAGIIRKADAEVLQAAANLIRAGKLVAFPTETVYGLGGDATNARAVASIFAAKGRPTFNPLIAHVPDLEAAHTIGRFSPEAVSIAEAFWPGPLTLVVNRQQNSGIADLVTAGLGTIAIRIPAHPVAQALLKAVEKPLAAPSANRSGHVSATEARHVAEDLSGRIALVLDGGSAEHGVESTILNVSGDQPILLRPGAITKEALETTLGRKIESLNPIAAMPNAPGQLESHYAPSAAVRLNVSDVKPGEALLAFGRPLPGITGTVINLSPDGDLIEAAAKLFSALRTLDATGAKTIAVMPVPMTGLGVAINDRLRRAAAPRG